MSEERIQREAGVWELAAAACFVVAVLSVAVGFVLTTDWILNARLHPALHAIGIVLLIVGIPLVILGGHFMDLGEKKNKHVAFLMLSCLFFLFISSMSPTVQAKETSVSGSTSHVLNSIGFN